MCVVVRTLSFYFCKNVGFYWLLIALVLKHTKTTWEVPDFVRIQL